MWQIFALDFDESSLNQIVKGQKSVLEDIEKDKITGRIVLKGNERKKKERKHIKISKSNL